MDRTIIHAFNPNINVDAARPVVHTKKLSTEFPVNSDGFIDISSYLLDDFLCSFCETGEQDSPDAKIEARRQTRFPVDTIDITGEISFSDRAEIVNISENGVLLNVSRKMDIGKKYMLKICHKGKKVVLRASVVWYSLRESRLRLTNHIVPVYTAGMEFKDISRGNKEVLRELLCHIGALTHNRKCKRVPFIEDIVIDGISRARSSDISEEGLYISSLQSFERNCVVDVTIPSGREKLTVKAQVQFCDKLVGFGLRFVYLNDMQRTKIKELIEKYKADMGLRQCDTQKGQNLRSN
jgi:hypothetical protein